MTTNLEKPLWWDVLSNWFNFDSLDGANTIDSNTFENTLTPHLSGNFHTDLRHMNEDATFSIAPLTHITSDDYSGYDFWINNVSENASDFIITYDYNDYVSGRGGDDLISARGGQDIVRGGAGNDLIYSQTDTSDIVSYSDTMNGVTVSLQEGITIMVVFNFGIMRAVRRNSIVNTDVFIRNKLIQGFIF